MQSQLHRNKPPLSYGKAVRVKWRCKRPPVSLVTEIARKALSGAMPNRKAMMWPASLSGRQLELFCEKQPRWMNITFGKPEAQNPAYELPFFFRFQVTAMNVNPELSRNSENDQVDQMIRVIL